MATLPIGYIALLRENRPFRRLWYGQIVSQLGDWFDSIALYTLLLHLTNSGQAVGALIIAQFLPSAFVGLGAGVIIDRLPRKLVMVATDLLRALLVLLFLLVRNPDQIWLIYLITIIKVTLSSFFEPARSAIIPNLARREELVAANGLSGATWSAMLAIGAALGGIVVGTLGTDAAFVIDAASFIISAFLIGSIAVSETHLDNRPPTSHLHELREGFIFLVHHRDIALYTLTKALWSLGGGVLLVLTLFGRNIFPLGVDGAFSIGLLYAARGVGAGLGPVIAQHWGGSSPCFLRRAIGPAFLLTSAGYLLLSVAPSLPVAFVAVMIAHAGGSTEWVFSTALLQMNVPNRLQGRIFAVELALLMLTTSLSNYLLGAASDGGWHTRGLASLVALVFVLPGLGLALLLWSPPTSSP